MKVGSIAFVLLTLGLVAGRAHAHSGPLVRGFGSATVDAVQAPGEWDPAGRHDFAVNRAPAEGGGTVPATLYVMNDRSNLYVALRVANASVGSSTFRIQFDNDHGGRRFEAGDDALDLTNFGFRDLFYGPLGGGLAWVRDQEYGGTVDGAGLDADHAGFSFYEMSHPLDTADDAHDFSLRAGSRIGFEVDFAHCVSGCVASAQDPTGDLVVVSGTQIPPETQITAGPAAGTVLAEDSAVFEFTGSDDAVPATALSFECSYDTAAWEPCTIPYRVIVEEDGRHVFRVRAIDEGGIADPTPAERAWVADTTGPARPRVRGPRVTGSRTPLFTFSSTDAVTPRGAIRFHCAFDRARLRPCGSRVKRRMRPGRHVLRVLAVDRVGNESEISTFRFRVRAARR